LQLQNKTAPTLRHSTVHIYTIHYTISFTLPDVINSRFFHTKYNSELCSHMTRPSPCNLLQNAFNFWSHLRQHHEKIKSPNSVSGIIKLLNYKTSHSVGLAQKLFKFYIVH